MTDVVGRTVAAGARVASAAAPPDDDDDDDDDLPPLPGHFKAGPGSARQKERTQLQIFANFFLKNLQPGGEVCRFLQIFS